MADGPSSGVAQAPFPKSRGVTACQKCRTRKTRCDNRRPTCGFCLKRHLTCVYPADEDPGSVTGAEILQAIHHLTKIVENQHSPQQSPAQTVESLSSSVRQPTLDNWAVPQNVTIRPQGVESILSWKIFAADRPASCLFAQSTPPSLGNYPVPDTSYPQLAWLEAQYIEALHTKNPIIDLDELHHMMIHVAEHGFDWSTGACLVALVCANAAITDSHTEMSSSPEVTAKKKAEIELSMQFWSVAVKRLGYASAQNTVQAVQCLCLAGIWYMHRLEPLEAWKHFNLAGAAWHTLSLTHGELSGHTEDQGCSNEFTLMQALCFTIWKSECELRLELPLPTLPILDNAYLPLAFPQPPDFGSHPDASDKERSWYYYLSEIAARHVINRLVQMNSEAPEFPNEKHVRRMISQAELMQSQISDWHSSLPPIFHFDTPQGYTADAVADPMVFILRHRYISLCELVSRPFVRLCVDQLADEMDASLHGIITSYASQCVRFCILKLDQVAGHRHQGTWYGIRVATSAALILAAVDRAQRQAKEDEAFRLVQSVTLPETWKGAVARGAASVQQYLDEPNGGCSNLKGLLEGVVLGSFLGDFDVEHVIQNASVSDKISLLSGRDFWHTNPLPAFNVPSVRVSDGPNGVRGTKFVDGVPAACLPCGTGLAATWDQDLLYKAGVLIGNECIAKGAHCWLGPTVCIQRSPLGGRGFESMAEDPYATGKLAAAYIKGVQSTGVVSIIKHWLANDQEHERVGVNVVASERALREVHMLPFQIALSDAAPGGVMACYNKVNGKHVSENRDFLDSLLREEWQWKGLIMSDWFGTYSTTEAINAGLDLEMPGPTRQRGQLLDLAVSTRKVSRSTIDARARNVLEFVQRCTKVPVAAEEGGRDYPEDRQLNRKLAGDSVVLLKNENNQLPLKRPFKSIALIGPNMKTTSFCGGGSAHLRPYYTVSPYEGIVAQLPPDVEVRYEVGASASGWNPLMQGEMMTTPEGSPGMRMRFYSQGPSVPGREIIDESHLPDSSWLLMGYSHPKLDKLFYATVEGDLVIQETGLFEFGLAVYGSARLYVDDQLLIDNNLVQRGGTFFFGKGTVEEKAQKRLVQGQKYRITVEYESAPSSKLVKPGVVNFGGGAGRVGLASAIDPEIGIQNAVSAALQSDVTILCVGMTRDQESEGFDRPHMDLPGSLPRLASAVLAAVPDAIVVTQSGTPFNMLWAESAKTHVHAWLAGNETGNGIADVLFGATCPSGKLPLSFPRRLQDTPTFLNFGSERGRVIYGEDIYVGYRYYEKVDRDVLYPFGHGLSYTTITYDKLNLASSHVSFEITNSGSVPGAEVSQLYIAADEATSSIQRPKKELKGFKKTYLQPGETRRVEISLDRFTTSFWDEELHCWSSERGSDSGLIKHGNTVKPT
ncbi:glycosyl hydrolase family 3 N terminal domain-containing protein [Fusarium oxysporum f. sp. albedinis]|nr:glycosyl hydrolase family 3 N terminal domain-containing protein [Fusarium oxysporum f. sp. albedinis]